MMRSYLLQETRPVYLHTAEEVLFPEVSKQTTHESITSRDMFQSQPFIFIDHDSIEFRCELDQLHQYEDDKLKFVTRVKVDQSRCGSDKNRIMLVKEPVYSNGDTITFLLILEWYPNYVKAKQSRKGSFASQKQLSVRSKQRTRLDIEEMLSAVFLLSEKIYIEERHIDEFMNVIAERHEIHHRQLNCLTIFEQQLIEKHNANMQSSTQAETRYFYYQNEGSSNFNYVLASDMDRSSVRSHTENIKPLLRRNSSSRVLEKSPKSSLSKSMLNEQQQKQSNFNVKRVKKYFSTIEYLISDGELRLEVIIYHLNDNRNIITTGFRLQTIQQLFKQWGRWGSYAQLYVLNRDKVLSQAVTQCTNNYRQMVSMELSELDLITLDNIYTITKEFNAKMTAEFLEETQEFVVEPNYGEWIKKLTIELCILEQELINNYSLTKQQYGERIVRNLLKKSNRSSGQNYALTKIVGKEEISTLDIGFRMYKKIIEQKLPAVFEDLMSKDAKHKYTWRGKGHNDENELNNIENRIDLCQDRKKGLDKQIELIQKQAQILEEVLRGVQDNWQQGESMSEHRPIRMVSL